MALESIALIPSGYKANKLYCQLPVDGGADLTTSRASGATRVNKNGLIEDVAVDVPRLDYTNGGCPELLLEPQRRNLFPYSEDFSVSDWIKANATITSNYAISPDGTMNASRLQFTGASQSFLYDFVTYSAATDYTISFYLKSNGGGQDVVRLYAEGISANLTATNEWVRHTFTFTGLGASKDSGLTSVSAEGHLADVLIWGLQVEDDGASGGADYATSYIRTSGTSVTRIADAVTGNSSLGQVINSSEGVLYFEGSALVNDDTIFKGITLADSGGTNYVLLYITSALNNIRVVVSSGSVQFDKSHNVSNLTSLNKIAIKWKVNDFALWVNGVEVATDLIGSAPTNMSILQLKDTGISNFYGRIKELKVYDTALTDAELTTLTTL